MPRAPFVLALPCVASALRLWTEQEADVGFSTGSSLGYDYRFQKSGGGDNSSQWPDKWMIAYEEGRSISHQLDEDRLFQFVHAYSSSPGHGYGAETMPLPEFGIPSMKMQHAMPGWKSRTDEEDKRVTDFPSYLALASSWDKDLVFDVAMAVSEEFKTLGANVMLGPVVNIHRATQAEAEFDSLAGEDPTLGSVLVRSWIMAAQTHGIMTVPKSIGKAEQAPVHWETASSNMTAWDIYYPPFETAIDVGASAIMCASHEVNGLWSCRDQEMLERDLRGIMGFQGMVMSDAGSAREYFPYASSYEKGLDLALDEPEIIPRSDHMIKGMRRAATRVIASIWHLRLEMNPGCKPPECKAKLESVATTPEHVQVAKRAAGSAIILMKNKMEVLPLDPARVKSVAIFGPGAAKKTEQSKLATPWDVMKADGEKLGFKLTTSPDNVDVCVVLGESSDTKHWELSEATITAIDEAREACPKIAVFMELRGTVLTPWREQAHAIAMTFPAGQETASGWSQTLYGTGGSPSGKLPISFPDSSQAGEDWWAQSPPSYWDNVKFAFPFGHGLSYATFAYSDFKEKSACHFALCVIVTVTNTSPKFSGAEVVQVYFKFPTGHPVVLRGFHKTKVLAPGASEKVFFPFTYRDISLYQDAGGSAQQEKSWVPQEEIRLLVGSSSKDIRQETTFYPKFQ